LKPTDIEKKERRPPLDSAKISADCDLFGPSIEGFPVEQNEDTLIVRRGNPK